MAHIVSGRQLMGVFAQVAGVDMNTIKSITIRAAWDEVVTITIERLGTDEDNVVFIPTFKDIEALLPQIAPPVEEDEDAN